MTITSDIYDIDVVLIIIRNSEEFQEIFSVFRFYSMEKMEILLENIS